MNIFNRTSPLLNRKCLQNKIQKLTPLLKKLEWGANMDGLFRASWSYYASDCRERLSNIRSNVQQHARLLASKGNRNIGFEMPPPQASFALPPNLNMDEYVFKEFMTCFRDTSRQDSRQTAHHKRGKRKQPAYGPTPEQWFAWKKEIVNVKQKIMQSSNPYEKEELMKRLSHLHKLIQRQPLVVMPFAPDSEHSDIRLRKNRKKVRNRKSRLASLSQQFPKHARILPSKIPQQKYTYGYRYANIDELSVSSFSDDVILLQQELLQDENSKRNAAKAVTNRKVRYYKQKSTSYSYFNEANFFNSWKNRGSNADSKDQKGNVVRGDSVSLRPSDATKNPQQDSENSMGSHLQGQKQKNYSSGGPHRPYGLKREESKDRKNANKWSSSDHFEKLPVRPKEVSGDPNFINQMPPSRMSKKLKRVSADVDQKAKQYIPRPSMTSMDDGRKTNKMKAKGPPQIPDWSNDPSSHWGLDAKVSKKFSSFTDLRIPFRKTRSEGALGEIEREMSSYWSASTVIEEPIAKSKKESQRKEAAPNQELHESKEDAAEGMVTVKKSRSNTASARKKSISMSKTKKGSPIKSYYSQLVGVSQSTVPDSYIGSSTPQIPEHMASHDKNETTRHTPSRKTAEYEWKVFPEDRTTSSYKIPYAPTKKFATPIATLPITRSKMQQQNLPEKTEAAAKNPDLNISASREPSDQEPSVSIAGTELEMYKVSIEPNATDNLLINNEENRRSYHPKPINITELINEFMDNVGLEIWWDQSIKKIFRPNALDHSSFTSIRNKMKFVVPPERGQEPKPTAQMKVRKFKMKRVKTKYEQVQVPVTSTCSLCHMLHKKTSGLRPYMQKMVKQRQQLELRTHYTQMLLNYHRKNQVEAERQKRVCTREVLTSCFQALSLCENILARKRLLKVQEQLGTSCCP